MNMTARFGVGPRNGLRNLSFQTLRQRSRIMFALLFVSLLLTLSPPAYAKTYTSTEHLPDGLVAVFILNSGTSWNWSSAHLVLLNVTVSRFPPDLQTFRLVSWNASLRDAQNGSVLARSLASPRCDTECSPLIWTGPQNQTIAFTFLHCTNISASCPADTYFAGANRVYNASLEIWIHFQTLSSSPTSCLGKQILSSYPCDYSYRLPDIPALDFPATLDTTTPLGPKNPTPLPVTQTTEFALIILVIVGITTFALASRKRAPKRTTIR